jgi:hypothetical protein
MDGNTLVDRYPIEMVQTSRKRIRRDELGPRARDLRNSEYPVQNLSYCNDESINESKDIAITNHFRAKRARYASKLGGQKVLPNNDSVERSKLIPGDIKRRQEEIIYLFRAVYGSPPEEDWNFTIQDILLCLCIPSGSRESVHKILTEISSNSIGEAIKRRKSSIVGGTEQA